MQKPLPTVIVLAAGRSTRFRAASAGQDKLQALLGQRSVREHTIAAVQASGLPWHVVEAAHTAHITLPGMGDSIATGVRACALAAGWLILPADLPLVQPATLRAVAGATRRPSTCWAISSTMRVESRSPPKRTLAGVEPARAPWLENTSMAMAKTATAAARRRPFSRKARFNPAPIDTHHQDLCLFGNS